MLRLFSSIALIFTFLIFASLNQKLQPSQIDIWEELEVFHQAIALTFHPAEDGDFEPVKNDSDELVEAAEKLSTSKLPTYFEKAENEKLKNQLQITLQKLVTESRELHFLITQKKGTDKEILSGLSNLHSTYHHIEELNSRAKKTKKDDNK